MSKDSIIFKGIPNGLLIILDEKLPFDKLQELFLAKVQNSKYLLEDASLLIKFKGKVLSQEEEEVLLNILSKESNVKIINNNKDLITNDKPTDNIDNVDNTASVDSVNNSDVISNDSNIIINQDIVSDNSNSNIIINQDISSDDSNIIDTTDLYEKSTNLDSNFKNLKNFRPFKNKSKSKTKSKTKITSKLKSKTKDNNNSDLDNNNLNLLSNLQLDNYNNFNSGAKTITHFHKGNVRSGQTIEFNGTIVIIGDINPGGKIVASGNIIVLGKLRGIVHAGCQGDDSCFVSALHLHPAQLFIGEVLTYFPTNFTRDIVPEYAYLKDGKICIEQL